MGGYRGTAKSLEECEVNIKLLPYIKKVRSSAYCSGLMVLNAHADLAINMAVCLNIYLL